MHGAPGGGIGAKTQNLNSFANLILIANVAFIVYFNFM